MSNRITRTPDISRELLIMPFQQGVKLIRPDKVLNHQKNWHTVSKMLGMPFHVYFMNADSSVNTDSVVHTINECTAMNCGFTSVQDAEGRTVRGIAKKSTADYEMQHDRLVMTLKKMVIKDEVYQRLKDNFTLPTVTIKFPWYNDDNKTVGLFGCSIMNTEYCSLAGALSIITESGLLSPNPNPGSDLLSQEKIIFTPRENSILQLLVRGKTAKEIGSKLRLSPRTIENYLANIKMKVGVSTKSALIEVILDQNQ